MKYELATFAGGCFWCMVSAFSSRKGVYKVISGYIGGKEKNPSYEQVCSGKTGHLEAIQIFYNPKEINYQKLLEIFWMQVDPTDDKGQFADRGNQYKTAIFYHDEEQKELALNSKNELEKSRKFDKIVTEIRPVMDFYPAEEYHQNYYKKNPLQYKSYRYFSGRDQYLKKVWGNKK